MLLSEVFRTEFIIVGLQADDKDEVFEEMVAHFCDVTGLETRDAILCALREREAKMSTGIQNGIAIPHGKSNAVDKMFGVLGVSKKGIDYDSLDGNPVHLVMMLIAPPIEAEQHLNLLQRMANFLRNPQFYTDVVNAKSAGEISAILNKYEDAEAD
ncbi:MAG: PTS sugar transporter subunit IIA [Spirochaetaceae bacterium]|jgi:PTS system fructose-specific IIC component/PTS system nitrogen regulatory IIA component|nr:PTS sugar transporter subunit IIA [Spirochaetaceae bacterium]GMO16182.1 MAG: PTS sugar transporter subunit IIA [Termitinemataceae bacterium]